MAINSGYSMLMGSVSTFLVHNSPVPVSVVRPQKKEKTKKQKKTSAQKLSQSVMNGHLKVDEAELSLNSYDGTANQTYLLNFYAKIIAITNKHSNIITNLDIKAPCGV